MRRDPALHDLSRDHHQLLLLARNLRGDGKRDAAGAWDAFRAWWPSVEAHFQAEERHLGALAPAYVARLCAEHDAIRALADNPGAAIRLGGLLRDHVRYEEDVVFQALQQTLLPDEMGRLGERLRQNPSGLPGCRL